MSSEVADGDGNGDGDAEVIPSVLMKEMVMVMMADAGRTCVAHFSSVVC